MSVPSSDLCCCGCCFFVALLNYEFRVLGDYSWSGPVGGNYSWSGFCFHGVTVMGALWMIDGHVFLLMGAK